MNFYKKLRKDPSLSLPEKTALIRSRLESLEPQFRSAFGSKRPAWPALLEWIEEVEFELGPTPVNRYSLLKRRWRFSQTIPRIDRPGPMLDLGCGLGTDSLLLHVATGVSIAGIDMDEPSLATCSVRLEIYKRWLDIPSDAIAPPRKMNAANLGFDDATFDYAWSNESIEHIHPTDALFREVARVLKPESRFFVLNQNGMSLYERLKAIRTRGLRVYWPDTDPLSGETIMIAEERLLTPGYCRRLLEQVGFGDTRIYLNGAIPSPLATAGAAPESLARLDALLCRMPLLRTQASDFVLISQKVS